MRALTAALLLCFVSPCFAQSCDQQIAVNIRDSKGESVPDLQASSFHAKVGGHEATVSSAAAFTGPIRLVLLLDASGSMRAGGNNERWNAVKNLAEQIVYFAPPSTSLALIVFNSQTIRRLNFGHPRKELRDAIERCPVRTE